MSMALWVAAVMGHGGDQESGKISTMPGLFNDRMGAGPEMYSTELDDGESDLRKTRERGV